MQVRAKTTMSLLRKLAYGALAIRIRGIMVVANALYIMAICVAIMVLGWDQADPPDWLAQAWFVFVELLLFISSLGTIIVLFLSRLIPIPFLKRKVMILCYAGVVFVVLLNAWYIFVNIGIVASGGETGDPLQSPDYMGHIAVLVFYPLLALVNIIALAMVRVKQRVL